MLPISEVIFGSYPVQKLNTLNQRMKNLEDDNKRLAARNENLIDEIRRINKKYGRETWSEPSSDEDRRQVYMNGEPASVVPVIYTNLNIAEKNSVIITGGTLNGTTLSNVSKMSKSVKCLIRIRFCQLHSKTKAKLQPRGDKHQIWMKI